MSISKSMNCWQVAADFDPLVSCNCIVQPSGLHSHHDSTVLRGSSYEDTDLRRALAAPCCPVVSHW